MACPTNPPCFAWHLLMAAVYRIPILGGFCAPTESTDESCFRHVSNEYTLPGVDLFPRVSGCVESPCCCVRCGAVGLDCVTRHRKPLFSVMLACNAISMILCVFAALSMSQSYEVLKAGYWTRADVEFPLESGQSDKFQVFWGINTRVFEFDCGGFSNQSICGDQLVSNGFVERDGMRYSRDSHWNDASCMDTFGTFAVPVELTTVLGASCEECKDSLFSSTSLVGGVITQIPTMATDCQRMTEFGDVNCQKVVGVMTNVLTFIVTFISVVRYREGCFVHLASAYHSEGRTYTIVWQLGHGWRCLIVAMFIKVIDATAHILVKTPLRCRRPVGKGPFVDYLRGDVEKTVGDGEEMVDEVERAEVSERENQNEVRVELETTEEVRVEHETKDECWVVDAEDGRERVQPTDAVQPMESVVSSRAEPKARKVMRL